MLKPEFERHLPQNDRDGKIAFKEGKPLAIVVLSGGQDSATTLAKATFVSNVVGAVHFQYGQKHAVEFECATWWADHYGIPLAVVPVNSFAELGNSHLLAGSPNVAQSHPHPALAHLPASFVPGRNLVFLTLAAAYAMKMGATEIWTGVCEADEAGYPDCRRDTMIAVQNSIRLGLDFPELKIKAPLLKLNKAKTWQMADEMGVSNLIQLRTHTCYNGVHDEDHLHYWGFGCGECPACQTRKAGYEEYLRDYHPSSWLAYKAIVRDDLVDGDLMLTPPWSLSSFKSEDSVEAAMKNDGIYDMKLAPNTPVETL